MAATGRNLKFIMTAALEQELPLDLLKEAGIPVFSARAVASGILQSRSFKQSGVNAAVVITGVGPERARMAAKAICQALSPHIPLFVLNLGTAGLPKTVAGSSPVNARFSPGSLLYPAEILVPDRGFNMVQDRYFPIAPASNCPVHDISTLISLSEPLLSGDLSGDAASGVYFGKKGIAVDMEAGFQAEVFEQYNIPFYTVKAVSDFCDDESLFYDNLSLIRDRFARLLSPLLCGHDQVSVVIPVRNRPQKVVRAIDSVLSQIQPPRELIVVDDCSKDDTAMQVEKRFGQAVHLIRMDQHGGVARARNIGIGHSTGQWIALLDSDDEWKPGMLQSLSEFHRQNPFFEISQCDEIWIRNGRRVNRRKYHLKQEGWIWDISLERCMISPSAVMFSRRLFELMGPFREDFPACEDYDLWLRITRFFPVGLDPEPNLIKYGGHPDQLSRTVPVLDRFRVEALRQALVQERDRRRIAELKKVLRNKLWILKQGAEKRGLVRDVQRYDALLQGL